MAADLSNTTQSLVEVSPELVHTWMISGDCVLIDVREDYEHADECIAGAVSCPLSVFDAEALRQKHRAKRLVFQCRSGKRSADAASRYRVADESTFHLAGGIEAWKAAGLPVMRAARSPKIPLIRQVLLVAGLLVVIGTGLGVWLSPWFLTLAAFVGVGLTFAGLTGWCGLAMVLGHMPWNRVQNATTPAACCSGS